MAPSGMVDTERVHKGPLYCPNGHLDLYYKEKKVCKSKKTISLEALGRKRRVLCSDHNVEVSIASMVGTCIICLADQTRCVRHVAILSS